MRVIRFQRKPWPALTEMTYDSCNIENVIKLSKCLINIKTHIARVITRVGT